MDGSYPYDSKDETLIPGEMFGRMNTDEWMFGLLLKTGDVLCISRIIREFRDRNDDIWLDVELLRQMDIDFNVGENLRLLGAPTARLHSTVRADMIVCAFELADS